VIGIQSACLQYLLLFFFITKYNDLVCELELRYAIYYFSIVHMVFKIKTLRLGTTQKVKCLRLTTILSGFASVLTIYLFCTCRVARQYYRHNRHHRRTSTQVARISHYRKYAAVGYIQHEVLAVGWWLKPAYLKKL